MIGVIGAGNFGTAIGYVLAKNGHDVCLLSRDSSRVQSLNQSDCIPGYDTSRPETLSATLDIHSIQQASHIVVALPTQQVRGFLESYGSMLQNKPVLLLQKGVEKTSGKLPTEIVSEFLGGPLAVMSGPNFAAEIIKGFPTATVVASTHSHVAMAWADYLKSPMFRPYTHQDILGAQLAGAVKNVIAIACGVVKGLQFGDNTIAAIITRGLSEMVRLGVAIGAQKETFFGLAGMGDLTLTCNGSASRNLRFGIALAQQQPWDEAMDGTAEGYHTAFSLAALIETYNIDMPISRGVLRLIQHEISPQQAVSLLMERDLKQESF